MHFSVGVLVSSPLSVLLASSSPRAEAERAERTKCIQCQESFAVCHIATTIKPEKKGIKYFAQRPHHGRHLPCFPCHPCLQRQCPGRSLQGHQGAKPLAMRMVFGFRCSIKVVGVWGVLGCESFWGLRVKGLEGILYFPDQPCRMSLPTALTML